MLVVEGSYHLACGGFTKSWLMEATVPAMLIALRHGTEYAFVHIVCIM